MDISARNELRRVYKITAVIGLVMMAGPLVCAVVVETIKKQYVPFAGFAPMPDDTASTFRYVLLAVAVVEYFLIRIVNRYMLAAKRPVPSGKGQQFGPAPLRLMSAAVVTFAFAESVAVYGLVLFLVQGTAGDFYLFLLISLFYFSIFFPKYGAWEAWVNEREKNRRT